MREILFELRRRGVVKVVAGYAVVAWIIAQVADLAADSFAAPAWLMPMLLVLLALGLPLVVVLAWAYQITPDGIGRAPADGPTAARARWLLAGAVVLALGAAAYPIWRVWPRAEGAPAIPAQAAGAARSVAVLPFVDMSQARDQEWFADGLSEEILNALASLPELKVTARTSSFQFKGADRNITDIASALGVQNILEGSVRRFDKKLVVTAQLIRASDGTHLWSETYERGADDLFEVQRDVAENVAATLDVLLDDAKREVMFSTGTRNVQAFEAYRKGAKLSAAWHADPEHYDFDAANVHLERALALDPGYAAAAIMHADPFTHIVLDGMETRYTQEQAGVQLRRDLDYAVEHATNPTTRWIAELDRAFLSTSWHRVPDLLRRLGEQPPGVGLGLGSGLGSWSLHFLLLGDRDVARRVVEYDVESSPLYPVAWSWLAALEVAFGDPAASLAAIERGRRAAGDHQFLQWQELRALYRAGRREELVRALERYRSNPTLGMSMTAFMHALKGDSLAARKIMAADPRLKTRGEDYVYVYLELGDTAAAAALMKRIDALPFGPAILTRMFTLAGFIPFDLADTPNLAARLKEAGFDLADFGKSR